MPPFFQLFDAPGHQLILGETASHQLGSHDGIASEAEMPDHHESAFVAMSEVAFASVAAVVEEQPPMLGAECRLA